MLACLRRTREAPLQKETSTSYQLSTLSELRIFAEDTRVRAKSLLTLSKIKEVLS